MEEGKSVTKRLTVQNVGIPTISVCMIVRDEKDTLIKLLSEIKDVADEIVIVHTGFDKKVPELVKHFGAKVITDFVPEYFEYEGEKYIANFSACRNESLKHATKDYIIWLDADDFMTKADFTRLKFFIKNNLGTATFLRLIDKRADKEFTSLQLRVFPNHKGLEFEHRVHEQISFNVEAKGIKYSYSDIPVYHIGYHSDEAIYKKLKRNIKILELELQDHPDDFLTNVHLSKTYLGLSEIEEAKPFTDKAIELLESGKVKISKENAFLAYLGKVTILAIEGKQKEAIEFLEKNRPKFLNNALYKLTLGEMYFREKDYEKAYKDLLLIKTGKIDLGLSPVNAQQMLRTLNMFLMIASLYVGDMATAEFLLGKSINDPEFKIKRR